MSFHCHFLNVCGIRKVCVYAGDTYCTREGAFLQQLSAKYIQLRLMQLLVIEVTLNVAVESSQCKKKHQFSIVNYPIGAILASKTLHACMQWQPMYICRYHYNVPVYLLQMASKLTNNPYRVHDLNTILQPLIITQKVQFLRSFIQVARKETGFFQLQHHSNLFLILQTSFPL